MAPKDVSVRTQPDDFQREVSKRLKKIREAQWHWSDIPQSDVVGRLFPGARKSKITIDGSIPGIYWKPWHMPQNEETFLDRSVARFVEICMVGRPNLREDLMKKGIVCPFYAWRYHTAVAADKARKSYRYISRTRKKDIEKEIELWNNRISISIKLANVNPEFALPLGSIHLKPGDDDEGAAYSLLMARSSINIDLERQIKSDKEVINSLNKELDRLDRSIPAGTGKGAPDSWKTPFFIHLANLWKIFANKEIPYNNDELNKILQSATRVICKGADSIQDWSLTKTLRTKTFKDNKAGEGFRLCEGDHFSLNSETSVLKRGEEIKDLFSITKLQSLENLLKADLAAGAFLLIDYTEGDLALLVREVILRRGMSAANLLSPKVALQLGWLKSAAPRQIENALTNATDRAMRGDLAAKCVADLVRAIKPEEDAASALVRLRTSDRHAIKEFEMELAKRDMASPSIRQQDDDHKALRVALTFIAASEGRSSILSGPAAPSLFE